MHRWAVSSITAAALVLLLALGTLGTAGADGSWFDQPESDCDRETVVFAKSVGASDHRAWLDLPAGVYRSLLIAEGNVTPSPVWDNQTGRSLYDGGRALEGPVQPVTRNTSWMVTEDGDSLLMTRRTLRVAGSVVTVWTGLVRTSGGIALFDVEFMSGVLYTGDGLRSRTDPDDEWARSSNWRWEIVKPGACEPPDASSRGSRPSLVY